MDCADPAVSLLEADSTQKHPVIKLVQEVIGIEHLVRPLHLGGQEILKYHLRIGE
jgi:hypothetical protein